MSYTVAEEDMGHLLVVCLGPASMSEHVLVINIKLPGTNNWALFVSGQSFQGSCNQTKSPF